MVIFWSYHWFKYDFDKSTTHPKFDLTRVRAHDIQIMNRTSHVPVTLSSWPLGHQGPIFVNQDWPLSFLIGTIPDECGLYIQCKNNQYKLVFTLFIIGWVHVSDAQWFRSLVKGPIEQTLIFTSFTSKELCLPLDCVKDLTFAHHGWLDWSRSWRWWTYTQNVKY